jgi:hypothetical protein
MKIDCSLIGHTIVEALKMLFQEANSDKFPMLILWDDEPVSMAQLHRYLKSKKLCVFLRLGVTCNGSFLFDEIYQQLTSRVMSHKDVDIKIREVSKIIKDSKNPYTIIITNGHLIELGQISWLTGLMIELDLQAKFIYLFHSDHFTKRFYSNVEKKDPRLKYFLKRIRNKYAIIEY